jgi:hypothetical protein
MVVVRTTLVLCDVCAEAEEISDYKYIIQQNNQTAAFQ